LKLQIHFPKTLCLNSQDLKIDTKELDSWFKKYKEAINYGKVNMTCPELIINLDEKPVKLGQNNSMVVTKKGDPPPTAPVCWLFFFIFFHF